MKYSRRINYIDLARGFTIILVVLGHSYSEKNLVLRWIYSFHMPFFFIITGLLYGIKYNESSDVSIDWKSKARSLLLPYLFWGTAYQMFLWILGVIGNPDMFYTFTGRISNVLNLTSGPMWFLVSMFISLICFWGTRKYRWLNIGGAVFLLGISMTLHRTHPLIEAALRAFVGYFFICVGFYLKALFQKQRSNITFICLLIVSLILINLNTTVDMAYRVFGNPVLYVINGCLGTWLVLQLCMKVSVCRKSNGYIVRILKLWGEKSIVILCIHSFLIEILRLVDYKLLDSMLPRLGIFEGFVLTLAVMILIELLMPVIMRFFGWTFGGRD